MSAAVPPLRDALNAVPCNPVTGLMSCQPLYLGTPFRTAGLVQANANGRACSAKWKARHWQMQNGDLGRTCPHTRMQAAYNEKDSIVFTCVANVSHAVTGEVIRQGAPVC